MKTINKYFTLPVAAFILAACSTIKNGPEEAQTIQERHPISVDSQVITLTLSSTSYNGGLSSIDLARLKAFGQSYLTKGHGPITFTRSSDQKGALVISEAKKTLYNAGVSTESMFDAQYMATENGSDSIVLSYTHYIATPSACGVWKGIKESSFKNVKTPNFGCATQNNLAAMISDPRDLVRSPELTPPDAEFRIRGVEAFRSGEVTSANTDSEIEVQVSN